MLLLLMILISACSDESPTHSQGPVSSGPNKSTNPHAQSYAGDYAVELTVSADGSVFTYTITRTRPNAKTLSHFIINLDNCPDNEIPQEEKPSFSHIEYVTVNGSGVFFTPTEGSGTLCAPQQLTTNFIKIEGFGTSDPWVVEVAFDRGYQVAQTTGWFKAGVSCNQGTISGPGCPIEDGACLRNKGNLFTNGAENASWKLETWGTNGDQFFAGNEAIDKHHAIALWYANNGKKYGLLLAVLQMGAIQLRNLPTDGVQSSLDIVNNYLISNPCSILSALDPGNSYLDGDLQLAKLVENGAMPNCIKNPPQEVKEAVKAIGRYIKRFNCDETDYPAGG